MGQTMHVVLFGGENGYGNVGDQAMLLETVRRLQTRLDCPRITVLTERPDTSIKASGCELVRLCADDFGPGLLQRLTSISYNVNRYYRYALRLLLGQRVWAGGPLMTGNAVRNLWQLVKSADLVINYGSGGINDIFGDDSIVVWTLLYRWCAMARTPFFITGQGVGPLHNTYFRRLLGQTLPAAQGIGVRDGEISHTILRKLGIPNELVRRTFDDAATLPSAHRDEVNATLENEGVPRKGTLVGIHLRATDYVRDRGEHWARQMGRLISMLSEVLQAHVVAIPMCYNPLEDDREAARVVAQYARPGSLTLIAGEYRPELLKGVCSTMDINIGFSYHFALFGLTGGVPTLPLLTNEYYQLKMTGLLRQLEITDWKPVLLREDSTDRIIRQARRLLQMRTALRPRLLSATHRLDGYVEDFFDDMLEASATQNVAPSKPQRGLAGRRDGYA